MTGSASDADDLVQDAYARAMERPPSGELRPWLVTVALNLGRDLLRKRKRRGYVGPWLPEPAALGEDGLAPGQAGTNAVSTGARYELLESASFAFLVALEALTPQQRAVLLLRDVFDYSVKETAAALDITAANVKTTLHRARKRMQGYDRTAAVGDSEHTMQALHTFLGHLAAQDVGEVERMLAADCVALSDGGGEYFAARVPIQGCAKVAKFYCKIVAMRPGGASFDVATLNGVPALLASFADAPPGQAPHVVMLVDVGSSGKITRVYSLLKTEKVRALFAA